MRINNNKQMENNIEKLVLMNFIAVLKKYDKYPLFRCTVGVKTGNVISNLYKSMSGFKSIMLSQRDNNIFENAQNIDSFVQMLKDIQNGGLPRNVTDQREIQKYIAGCTNFLLHLYLERFVGDFKLLEEIGKQIFDMSCEKLFGKGFEDLLVPPSREKAAKMRELNQFLMECNNNGRTLSQDRLDEIRAFLDSIRRDNGNEDMWYAQPNLGDGGDEPVEEDYDDYYDDTPW